MCVDRPQFEREESVNATNRISEMNLPLTLGLATNSLLFQCIRIKFYLN
uniref:Uncharacterized protein n=1 Tax=Anguilla anguilla TaxID=7936 RepID=A0A0E9RHZ4_ANGAN